MSDGALSQAEIDALLGGDGGAAGNAAPGGGGASNPEAIQGFLGGTVESLSSNLSMMTGGTVTFSGPKVTISNRDTFLAELPDMVTGVKVDFTSGFPGEHSFLMGEDTAKAIAALMNKEENITLDDMAMSVISEAISQISGTQITALTNKTGNKSIAAGSPEAANVAKATTALPSGDFTVAAYTLNLGEGGEHQFWEVFGPQVSQAISTALTAPPPGQGGIPGVPPLSQMQGMVGGSPQGPIMGGMPSGGVLGQAPNMQSVQFPNLNNMMTPREQGNIGLLMDVSMEMTVELGRTRKQIKEILSMGEGTIIELDKLAGEPVDILVNHKLIAHGEVVVIDENFGVRVTEIVSPAERMPDMG
jgi:flagellar motor switch protein FliN/FliY